MGVFADRVGVGSVRWMQCVRHLLYRSVQGVREMKKGFFAALNIAKTGVRVASNPFGFAVEHMVETDADGNELPEIQAFQIKLDRITALLAFIGQEMNPEKYAEVFGCADDTADAEEDQQVADTPHQDNLENAQWL